MSSTRRRARRGKGRGTRRTKRPQRSQRGGNRGLLIGGALAILAVGAFVIVALRYSGSEAAFYPPTDIVGHAENVPPRHILTAPMPLSMQKHMLEHADGNGPPGVVINYNCQDFPCEPDLVERLTAIAEAYPEFVYLAPFPGMSAKIVVTRRGNRLILDTVDEGRIRAFIERS